MPPTENNLTAGLIARILLPIVILGFIRLTPVPTALDASLTALTRARSNGPLSDQATAAFRVLEFQPWRTEMWAIAGDAEFRSGNNREAVDAFRNAEKTGSLPLVDRLSMGKAYERMEDLGAARNVYEAIIKSDPNQEAFDRLIELKRNAEDWKGLEQTLRAMYAVYPDAAEGAFELGKLLAILQPEAAGPFLTRAAELNKEIAIQVARIQHDLPANPESTTKSATLIKIGRIMADLGDWQFAALAFEQAANVDPSSGDAWAFLGEMHQHMGGSGSAELEKARQLAPDSILVKALTAVYWRRNGKPEMAVAYLNQVIARDPTQAVWQVELGDTLASMGNPEAGLSHVQKAVELGSNDISSWLTLARYCASYDVEVRTVGLPAARQALMIQPENPPALDTMGWTMLKLGDLVSAERFLQRALQANANMASVHLHLGQLYMETHQLDLSQRELRQALDLENGQPDIQQMAKRLLDRYFGGS